MGAKLSKKKKGYCLGAGKDGESTETTEVEQKETENQEGQKDAAEPKGEKTPTVQSYNNGVNEEKREKISEEEVASGETTKEDSNKDQKSKIKSNTEEKNVDARNQSKCTENVENKPAASEKVCQEREVKSPSEDQAKTETEVKEAPKTEDKVKETPSVAADKPTQESKPASEKEDSKLPEETVAEPSATILEEEVLKTVSESITKVAMEKAEKAASLVETAEHVPEKTPEEFIQAKESEDPEKSKKVPEKMEPPAPESVPIVPVPLLDVEAVVPEVQGSVNKDVVEPEKIDLSEPVTVAEVEVLKAAVESVLLESAPAQNSAVCNSFESVSELVKPLPKEPELVPESEPAPKPEEPVLPEAVPETKNMEVTVPEQPAAASPGEGIVKPEMAPESERVNEGTPDQGILSEQLPTKSTEVPDQTAADQEEPENQELLGCDQGNDMVTIQAAAIETFPKVQQSETSVAQHDSHDPSVIQDRSSKHSADEQAEVQHGSTVMIEDEGKQKEATEENDEKTSAGQKSHEVEDVLEMSNNENPKTGSQDTSEMSEPTRHHNSEEKTENREISEENKPSAPEIIDQHGVGNGLPIKQEIKVHLENGSDKGLHNGQSESHEIQVCNE